MYGYFTTFIIIFLTAPGVGLNYMSPGILGGLVHATVVLIMQLPSESGPGFSYTMSFIYYVMLGLWAYIQVRLALTRLK